MVYVVKIEYVLLCVTQIYLSDLHTRVNAFVLKLRETTLKVTEPAGRKRGNFALVQAVGCNQELLSHANIT